MYYKKSYVAYQMAPFLVTFSDLELAGHFCCLEPFYLTHLGKYSLYYLLYMNMIRKVHMACNFNYLFENKRLPKVTASHVH